jgi:DNA repair photolyase
MNLSKNQKSIPPRGRGADFNPPNRFETLHWDVDEEEEGEEGALKTQIFKDTSKSIITYNDSPDIGFSASLNPYRGCEHGCIYCYARPTHEYLGFSAGLDFESKILVKMEAPKFLRKELSSLSWKPQILMMSGVTDCYQPVERRLKITRGCLEVLAEFRNPVSMVTKNFLVTRDIDVLQELARHHAVSVFISLTTLDEDLRKKMEPRTSPPLRRLQAVEELAKAGIPVGVLVAPVIPALNEPEIPALLKAASQAGARSAGYVMLRLPFAVKSLFEEWLDRHFPEKKEKVLHRIQAVRSGKLNDPRFGSRMRGEGIFAEQVKKLFQVAARKYGLDGPGPELSTEAFRRPSGEQMELFK